MQATKPNRDGQPTLNPEALHPVPAVGVVCRRGDEVLLIRRGQPPRQGEWSIPGGKVRPGENLFDAALRELYEETGVRATITHLVEVYEIIDSEFHYILIDYAADWLSGDPRPGDDAEEACFMPLAEALQTVVQPDLRDVLLKAFG
ncbi:NUDIX hydrolase [Asticcacaulis sp. AC402]|uniref:NUDIX hydrolase n=1 Tax=Asticcacaulis sp. AC402 TaxID=1282361 RepID=UPI00068A03A5|nr:NUDIX hydrolase [Asticcacaulis sp. AC402]